MRCWYHPTNSTDVIFPLLSQSWRSSIDASSKFGWAIDFDAIDEQPVDLIFLLLAPEAAGADHLKALARISRLLRDDDVCTRLRGSDHAEALFALLTQTAEAPAA